MLCLLRNLSIITGRSPDSFAWLKDLPITCPHSGVTPLSWTSLPTCSLISKTTGHNLSKTPLPLLFASLILFPSTQCISFTKCSYDSSKTRSYHFLHKIFQYFLVSLLSPKLIFLPKFYTHTKLL